MNNHRHVFAPATGLPVGRPRRMSFPSRACLSAALLAISVVFAAPAAAGGQDTLRIDPELHLENERDHTVVYTVRRGGDTSVAATYTVTLEAPEPPAQLAIVGEDFVAPPATLTFAEGQAEQALEITLLDDDDREFLLKAVRIVVTEDGPGGASAGALPRIADNDNLPPRITMTSPTATSLTVTEDQITISGTVTDEDPDATVALRASNTGEVLQTTTENAFTFTQPLNPGRNYLSVLATDVFGSPGDGQYFQINREEVVEQTHVFAEGATGTFFDTELLFANPHFAEIPVTVDFLKQDGTVVTREVTLPATSHTTLLVDSVPGLEETSAAAVVRTNSFPIVVERTTRWGEGSYGAHTEKASSLSTNWYFAEGALGFYSTYLLLVNPEPTANEATVRFLRENEAPVTKTYPLLPHQRLTIDAGTVPELVDRAFGADVTFVQPGVAERSMYFGTGQFWAGGHASAGVNAPATGWLLAEGATGTFFETFVLIANPSEQAADVTLRFLRESGEPIVRARTIPAGGRVTINVELEDPELANGSVATEISSTQPVVAERAQYWPFSPDQWYESHGSFGVTAPGRRWGLAEGRIGGPENYQTYVLLANPNDETATVSLRYLEPTSRWNTRLVQVRANSRLNVEIPLPALPPGNPEVYPGRFGMEIVSTHPIVVERSMYASPNGQLWGLGTNATATPLATPVP